MNGIQDCQKLESVQSANQPIGIEKSARQNDAEAKIPRLGDIKKGWEIGRPSCKRHSFAWSACLDCGRTKWIRLNSGKPESERCHSCASKGKNSPRWNGGRHIQHKSGYVLAWVDEANPFRGMAKNSNRVLEHRLIMAMFLGRCLESWEVVHHKNGIKTDNRIENLHLLNSQTEHSSSIRMQQWKNSYEKEIKKLKEKIAELEYQNKRLRRIPI